MSIPFRSPTPSPGTSNSRGKPPIFAIAFLLMFPAIFGGFVLYQKLHGRSNGDGLRPSDHRSEYSLDMPTLDGGRWRVSEHAGKVLLINDFATWCEPCRQEMPDLAKIATDYKSRGVEVAAVGLDLDGETPTGRVAILKQFADLEHLPFPILLPPPSLTRAEMIPRTYLLDRHGRLAFFTLGRFDDSRMRAMLDGLLKED